MESDEGARYNRARRLLTKRVNKDSTRANMYFDWVCDQEPIKNYGNRDVDAHRQSIFEATRIQLGGGIPKKGRDCNVPRNGRAEAMFQLSICCSSGQKHQKKIASDQSGHSERIEHFDDGGGDSVEWAGESVIDETLLTIKCSNETGTPMSAGLLLL